MFENVSEKVNQQLEAQSAFTAKPQTDENSNGSASALNTPVESTIANAERDELIRLRQENAELRQKQLDAERDQRIKSAVAASNVQDSGPTAGEMQVRRQRAIQQAGGVARWYKIPVGDRVNVTTDGAYVPVKDTELARYFGPKSDPKEAARLKASDPRRYRSYRMTAIELNWIG